MGILGGVDSNIERLILAEFGAASLLICAGAVLGEIRKAVIENIQFQSSAFGHLHV
jgi:hypothetical protein